jgi:MoxR-like ATPase
LGASTDPRSFLIGNTHYDREKGTFFSESAFIKAIQTENAVILLDEISRCHPDGINILMSVLDDIQRYIRLDEKNGSDTIKVADGVCFLATANVGGQYTSTRVMDRALLDRFPVKLEMVTLTVDEEYKLLLKYYPDSDKKMIRSISEICFMTRDSISKEGSKITNFLSTRSAIEMAGLANDGFSLLEIAETAIYPNFSDDGGIESERTFMKQLIQKYISRGK